MKPPFTDRPAGRFVLHQALIAIAALCFAADSPAGVVINEIMYHPPDDRDDLQWIELHNFSEAAVDISGWSFKKGIQFVFPSGTSLPAGGFIVVARDTDHFRAHYPNISAPVAGNFGGKLSHGGETVTLADRGNKTVDSVRYADSPPWPQAADGYSSSLERICPQAAGRDPHNWAPSKYAVFVRAAGSPGTTNSNFSLRPLPIITNVTYEAVAAPGKGIAITASVAAQAGVTQVVVRATMLRKGGIVDQQTRSMTATGDAGRYAAILPGQAAGVLTRFWVEATDSTGAKQKVPNENEPRSSFSVVHFSSTNHAAVPFAYLVKTAPIPPAGDRFDSPPPPDLARGNAALVVAHANGKVELFDHVRVRERSGGWKIHLQHDRPFDGMTGLNIIYEEPRWVLSESLGHEVFRRAGVPAPRTDYVRMWADETPLGFFLIVEQVNKAFLAENRRTAGGDLFKLLWYGRDMVSQHEKKTNPATGHAELLALLDELRRTRGGAQLEVIRTNFNVVEVARYFAVCQLIGNWDGYHNNQFIYHDNKGTGKWEIYPWDLDKTFGDFDGAPSDYAWYDLHLGYGSEGDVSPPASMWKASRRQGPFGGVTWWRGGGPFSRPLLANAGFQKEHRVQLRQLLNSTYTEEKLFPWLEQVERQLEPEVRFRARVTNGSERAAAKEFRSNMDSLRNFITGRRKFLVAELGHE